MIVTIDGPAGAGKSTIARALAGRLGFRFLDTGAMYRAVALAAQEHGLDWDRPDELVALAATLDLQVDENARAHRWSRRHAGDSRTGSDSRHALCRQQPGVRAIMVEQQRRVAGNDDIVTDGRDQGTVVFPQRRVQDLSDRHSEERARRRAKELTASGKTVSFEEVLRDQNRRDQSDTGREVGPLVAAADAVEVPTDGLTPDEVLDQLERLVREKLPR